MPSSHLADQTVEHRVPARARDIPPSGREIYRRQGERYTAVRARDIPPSGREIYRPATRNLESRGADEDVEVGSHPVIALQTPLELHALLDDVQVGADGRKVFVSMSGSRSSMIVLTEPR
ncbi:hypothetical protein RRG08_023502 [Elysia crispata]|uniref:Uncharacterized protein n=1 Tax=Elysia crispata TaxID=231223 RepID=A0AAE0YY72_9GAST|nr:hypothetical protein RRG08_023502 [Elysia crispata]